MGKKVKVLLVLIVVGLVLGACAEKKPFDQEGFDQVESYSDEMISAGDAAVVYTYEWMDDPNNHNHDQMVEAAREIQQINDEGWQFDEEDEYNQEEIERWIFTVVQNDEEVEVSGEHLYDRIARLKEKSSVVADLIIEIDETYEFDIQEMMGALDQAETARNNLNDLLYD
ncbi:MAG TPA: hypothetical protein DHN33_04935 [Eubacteriaceae bacterium]|nr:hypothetical protein [Eubacteriaceae bacterium]